ncbi:ATP-binding protein [Sphingomonas immobilis]|uniref:histidine kinase n=1 Tax=Sphingomonas immobilis TaxID=3063997 RepID=A0ABT8ZWL5_9SPHN|nr:ATP-binding protein [Sphingomonas sp. CA1-15]MDO7841977.1 ATP-binding protein [Sphingomonas sp. CA1-15]
MSGTEGDSAFLQEAGDQTAGTAWRMILLVMMAVLGAAVLVGLIVTLATANTRRDEALKLQSHSYEVMILARTLSGTISGAEASLGRYVISGDQQLGQEYSERWQLAGTQIARLKQQASDNPAQVRLINELAAAYRARGRALEVIALSTNYKKNDQALGLYYQARKADSLPRIDRLLEEISDHEHDLLDSRTANAMRKVDQSNFFAKILVVFGVLIVIGAVVLGWLTIEAMKQEAIATADAEAERERAGLLEEAVTRATDELRAQEARMRQAQKMEAIGQLTGGIAHDFNNMLAVVMGGLELAKRQLGQDDELVEKHIDSATEGALRAAALTRRLLAFTREEALRTEPVDPGAVVAGMSDLLDRTLGDTIAVAVRDAGSGWQVRVDRLQLENVVLNLAVNARDAMDGRGTLTITTAGTTLSAGAVGDCPAGEYVSLSVTDTGAGMTPEVLERVFEPFFTTKPVGKGTGLGLSQVFAFTRQAEGEIALRSTPGEGTTVTLYLPRRDGKAAAPALQRPAPAVRQDVESGPLDILVVEDDPRVLASTIGALEELGHRATACNDPLAAPAMIAADPAISLVISDVLMPGQTGPEMIAGLLTQYPALTVVYVTGYAGDAGGEAEFGGHTVLRKPFTIAGLEAAIADAAAGSGRTMPLNGIAAE